VNDFDEFTPPRGTFAFGLKAVLYIIAFIAIVAVILGALGLVFGWFSVPGKVLGPENVTTQFQQAYDDINSLNAIAANICIDVKARDAYPKSSDGWTTNEQAVVAQEQNFQRIQNHYDAYIHDPFRAKLVRPRDLPDPAPTEAEAIAALPGGGCTV
jgi:hypothetical protein